MGAFYGEYLSLTKLKKNNCLDISFCDTLSVPFFQKPVFLFVPEIKEQRQTLVTFVDSLEVLITHEHIDNEWKGRGKAQKWGGQIKRDNLH